MGYLDKKKADELNNIKRERKIGNLGIPQNPVVDLFANNLNIALVSFFFALVSILSRVGDEKKARLSGDVDEYRKGVMSLIEAEVKNVIDEEMKKAAQELLEEQRKAIRQIVEEHRTAIREAVEEEKKAIHTRIEELRKSILRLGLE